LSASAKSNAPGTGAESTTTVQDPISDGNRAFYFWTVLWGDDFRQRFLNYCLPSLLAPANIPTVAKRRPVNLVVATTALDWNVLCSTEVFTELRRYVVPIFLELPLYSADEPVWVRAIAGKKICCNYIFDRRAYGIVVWPDHIYAEGSMRQLDEWARENVAVVISNSTTSVEEQKFLRISAETGLLRRGPPPSIAIAPRELAAVAMRSMHSMWLVFEWTAPYFWGFSGGAWWRVKGDKGMVLFGLGTEMILSDYAALLEHDSSALDERGSDGDYTMLHFGNCRRLYVIRDSDKFYSVGLDAASYNARPLWRQWLGGLGKGAEFRALYTGNLGIKWNWLQQSKLFVPTRIHTESIDEERWRVVEGRALQTLLSWVDPPLPLVELGSGLSPALTGYANLDAQITSMERRWWRRDAAIWFVTCRFVLPFVMSLNTAQALWRRIHRLGWPELLRLAARAALIGRR
jgi:hypothetical protein